VSKSIDDVSEYNAFKYHQRIRGYFQRYALYESTFYLLTYLLTYNGLPNVDADSKCCLELVGILPHLLRVESEAFIAVPALDTGARANFSLSFLFPFPSSYLPYFLRFPKSSLEVWESRLYSRC